jgi:predicted Zn-dependent protease
MAVQAHRSPRRVWSASPCRRGSDGGTRGWGTAAVALLLLLTSAAPAAAALINQDEEIRIGRQAAAQLEAEVGLARDPAMTARVVATGRRVAAVSSRRDLGYTFKVLRGREVNAVSLPGGFIYATEGLLRFVQSDHELAFVMAHEVGHVAARHHVAIIERHFWLAIIARLLTGDDPSTGQIADIVRFFLTRGFSREAEFEADDLGVSYAHRAGYDAAAGLAFMQRLRAAQGRDPSQFEVLFRTHPGLADRMQRVRERLRALGYRVATRWPGVIAAR